MDNLLEGDKHVTYQEVTVKFRIPVGIERKKDDEVKSFGMPFGVKGGAEMAKDYVLGMIGEGEDIENARYWLKQYTWLSLVENLEIDFISGGETTMEILNKEKVTEVEEEKVNNKK